MRFSVAVRCRHCQHDEFDTVGDAERLDSITRCHVRCKRCGRTYRLSMTMVSVRADRLTVVKP